MLVRLARIELASPGWEPGILPLNDRRLVQLEGIEPSFEPWQGPVLPLNDSCIIGGTTESRTRASCVTGRCQFRLTMVPMNWQVHEDLNPDQPGWSRLSCH